MKAISLWQPWASLWLSEAKVHETRHWPTSHRGLLLVHAAKRLEKNCGEELDDIVIKYFGPYWRTELPRGALLGIVRLDSCISTETMPPDHVATEDFQCGNFEPGRYAWQRGGAYAVFKEPIPYRGMQGMFEVPKAIYAGKWNATSEIIP